MNAEDKKILKVINFNSMIVRLKAKKDETQWNHSKNFNSMIVRLKEPRKYSDERLKRFQFYDNPIKSLKKLSLSAKRERISILW